MNDGMCSIAGCVNRSHSRGMCCGHYSRWYRRLHPPRSTARPVEERFWPRVNKTDSCWLWTGAYTTESKAKARYGWISVNRMRIRVHRFSYELLVGPIPEGLVIDHLCRVTLCVNPDHLEPVTDRENIRRGNSPAALRARLNVCKHGHEFTPENTYQGPNGRRACRTCRTQARADRYRRTHA